MPSPLVLFALSSLISLLDRQDYLVGYRVAGWKQRAAVGHDAVICYSLCCGTYDWWFPSNCEFPLGICHQVRNKVLRDLVCMTINRSSLPCTAIAMVLCYLLLRSRVKDAMSFDDLSSTSQTDTWISKLACMDWIATFLFVAGGILILLALNWGPDDNWKSIRTVVNLVIGAILVTLCIVWEVVLERKRCSATGVSGVFRAYPMIPLEMFTSVDMCIVQFGSFTSGIVVMVIFYFVPIFMTIVTGVPASQAGVRLLYFIPGLVRYFLIDVLLLCSYI